MGHTTAVILLGLGLSLAINGYRFAIRKVKILDAVTLAFLAVSAFGTFVLGSDLQATVQFHLDGDSGGAGYLEIGSGRCTFRPGEAAQPTLVIESPAEVWTAIARGEISGAEAFLSRAYRAIGDLDVLLRFDAIFRGDNRLEKQ